MSLLGPGLRPQGGGAGRYANWPVRGSTLLLSLSGPGGVGAKAAKAREPGPRRPHGPRPAGWLLLWLARIAAAALIARTACERGGAGRVLHLTVSRSDTLGLQRVPRGAVAPARCRTLAGPAGGWAGPRSRAQRDLICQVREAWREARPGGGGVVSSLWSGKSRGPAADVIAGIRRTEPSQAELSELEEPGRIARRAARNASGQAWTKKPPRSTSSCVEL